MSEEPDLDDAPRATVRRRPRYKVFVGVGLLLGVVAALVVTLTEADPAGTDGVAYGLGAIFGYLALLFGGIGAIVGGVVAITAAALVNRRR